MTKIFDSLSPENCLRLGCFLGILTLMATWELLAPRRQPIGSKSKRWFNNLALLAINAVVTYLLLPIGAAGFALLIRQQGWGLFNMVSLPEWLVVILAVVVLDLAIYLQHVLFHSIPLLWRLHRVHHADLDMDASTGLRFHTFEILLSLAFKLSVVLLLGAPALAVLIFEVILNGTSMFNHGNVRLPGWLDRCLRLLLVTPDMHRVHHSVAVRETNSNFGFNLPWWDRLFGTYRAQPELGHSEMTIGLPQFQDERVESLPWMLALPFVASTSEATPTPPINIEPGESPATAVLRRPDETSKHTRRMDHAA